jgi:hypothetical protein
VAESEAPGRSGVHSSTGGSNGKLSSSRACRTAVTPLNLSCAHTEMFAGGLAAHRPRRYTRRPPRVAEVAGNRRAVWPVEGWERNGVWDYFEHHRLLDGIRMPPRTRDRCRVGEPAASLAVRVPRAARAVKRRLPPWHACESKAS